MNDCLSTGSRHFYCTADGSFNGVRGDKMNQNSNPSCMIQSHHLSCNELCPSIHDPLTVRSRKNEMTLPMSNSCPVTVSPSSTQCRYLSSNNNSLVTPSRCKVHMKHEKHDNITNKCVTCVPCNNCKYTSTAKGEVKLTHLPPPLSSSSSPPSSMLCRAGRSHGPKRHHETSSSIKLVLMLSNVLLPLLLLLSRNVSSSAALPNYQTKQACEGEHLHLSCDEGYKLNIIRANFGRFSLSPCNPQGIADWSANCMSRKSFRVAQETCGNRTECTLHATTSVFSDPCPSAVKYLEVQYQCLAEALPTVGTGINSRTVLSPPSAPTINNPSTVERTRLPTSGGKSSPNSGAFPTGNGNGNNNNNGNGRNRKPSSSEYDSSEDRRNLPTNFTSSTATGLSPSSTVPLSLSPALNPRPIYSDPSSNGNSNKGDPMVGSTHSTSNSNNNNNGHRLQQQQQQQSNNNDDRGSVNGDALNLDHNGPSSSSSGTSSSSPSPSSLPHHHTYPHPIIVPTPIFNPSVSRDPFIPPSIEPANPHNHLPNSTGIIHNPPDPEDYEGTSSSLDSSSNFNDVTSTLSSSSLPLTESLRLLLTIGCVFAIICLFLTMLSLVMTSAATSSSSSSSSPSSSHLLNSSALGTNSASAAAAAVLSSSNNHSPAIESGLLGAASPCRSFTKSLRLELQVKQNLTLCLLIVEILLLIGINVSQNKFFCGIVAGTLHYFFLSIFIWLFFDGFTLYLALLKHQEVTNPNSNSPNGTVQLNHSPNSGSVLDVTSSTVNRNTHRVNSAQYSTQLSANGDLITSAHKSYHNQVPLTSRNDNCCSRSAKCYLLLAYGLPLIIQVTSSLLDTGSLFWISSSLTHCWLRSDKYFVLTFVGPVIAVLSANFLFLAITVVCSNYGSLFSSFDKFSLDESFSHPPVHHRSHHHLSSFNSNLPMYMNDYTIYTTNSLRKRLRTSLTIFVVMSLTLTALFVSLCQELPDDDLIFTSCLYTFALFNPIQVIVMLILFSSSTSIAKANSLKVLTSLGLFNGDSSGTSHHNSNALSLGNDKSNMALTSSSMNHGHSVHGHSVIHSTLLGTASSNLPTNNLNALNSLDSVNSGSAVRYVNTVGKDMQHMLLAHHSLSNGNSCHSSDLPIIPPPIHTSTLNLSEINGSNGGGSGNSGNGGGGGGNCNTGTISSTGADGGSIQSKPYSASDYGFRKNLGSTSVSLTYRSPVYGTTAGNNTGATLISTSTPVASSASVSSSGVTVTTSNSAAAAHQASLAASIAMRRAAVNAAGASVHVHTKQCLQLPCPYPHVVEHVYESIDEDPYVARLLLPVSTPMINRKLTNGNGNNLNC